MLLSNCVFSDFGDFLDGAISKAQDAGKKLIVEEWGSLYGGDREGNLKYNIDQMNKYKIPWFYWELITNEDPHQEEDYEVRDSVLSYKLDIYLICDVMQIAVNGENWDFLKQASLDTAALEDAPFDFSASLAL